MEEASLQERLAPNSICFGCGPANPDGLRIASRVRGHELVATFVPRPHHHAFPGVLNGGIIGTLLDCHSNWCAAHALMQAGGQATLPCTVTSEFSVKLRRPTPMQPVHLSARVTAINADRVTVDATLTCEGKVCATCQGVFVSVKEGHPAFHRW